MMETWILMATGLFILAVSVVAAVLFSSIRINMTYLRENKTDNLQLKIGFWFFTYTYKRELTREYIVETKEEFQRRKIRFPGMPYLRKPVNSFLRYARWQKMEASIVVGLDDAAVTGITVGLIWAFAGNVLSLMDRYFCFKHRFPVLEVQPDYERPGIRINLQVIFYIRIIYLLSIIFNLFSISIKHKEEQLHGK